MLLFQNGQTALHHAISGDELDVAQHLIELGADINIKDDVSNENINILVVSPLHGEGVRNL